MAKRRNSKPVNFLSVNKDGLLYKKSSESAYIEAKEKGETHIHRVELKDGRVVYHEVFDAGTEDGFLQYMGITEREFPTGKQKFFSLVVGSDDTKENDQLSFPLYNNNKNLNGYVKNLATILPNLDFSKKINFVPSTKKNDRGYVNQSIFINYPDEKDYVRFKHKFGKEGDIPAAEKVEKLGQTAYDFQKQDEFLYNILVAEIDRFKEFKGTSTPPAETSQQVENVPETIEQVDEDDLPF